MRTHEVIDALCFDDPQSPYPLEALRTLEGLQYVELIQLYRISKRGEELPPWRELAQGEERRRMARALGATEPEEEIEIARQAGPALDQVAKVMRRAGVPLPELARGELLRTAAAVYGARVGSGGIVPQDAVAEAAKLIEAVDGFMASWRAGAAVRARDALANQLHLGGDETW